MSSALVREIRRVRDSHARGRGTAVPEDPLEFARSVGFEPDPWQAEILSSDHPRKILLAGRQTGKTSVASLLALHKALTCAGSTTLIVAPAERQAKLAFSRAAAFYRKAGAPVALRSDRRTGMEFMNGSVVEALPALERTTRGFSTDLLIIDEAAAVGDEDFFALLPSLIATRGEQLLLSTPRGKRGFFHSIWADDEEWFKTSVRSDEVPRIRAEDLERFRRAMPSFWFRQEFMVEWLDPVGSLFRSQDIAEALARGEHVQALNIEEDEW